MNATSDIKIRVTRTFFPMRNETEYSAMASISELVAHGHLPMSRIYDHPEGPQGLVGTDPQTAKYKDLQGKERSDAVYREYAERAEVAYRHIMDAYPHLAGLPQRRCMGAIVVDGDQ